MNKLNIMRPAILAVFMLSLCWSGPAQAKWIRAETKNFIFYSSGTLSQLEDFAIETEKFDAVLRQRFNIPQDEITNRLTIYVVPTAKQVSALRGLKQNFLGGFYQVNEEGSFAVINRERPNNRLDQSGMEILFHEYTHHFFARHLPVSYPQWLTEGFAEYYSTVEFARDGSYTVGNIVGSRAYGLLLGKEFPIRKVLFDGLHDDLNIRERDIFYGRSWLLTHKLLSTQEGRVQLTNYIRDFNSIKSPEQTAQDNFGDLDALDRELEKLTRIAIPAFKYNLQPDFDVGFTARELDKVEGELIELQLHRRTGATPVDTRDRLQKLATANPGHAGILNELAHAEHQLWGMAETDEEETRALQAAEAFADAALAIEPQHVRANLIKARLMAERLRWNAGDDEIKVIRRHIITANRADPLDPLPLYHYFMSFIQFAEDPPEIAMDGLAQSFSQAPEITGFRVNLAFAYAREGDFESARGLVRYLAYNPHFAKFGNDIMSQLDTMQIGQDMNERRRKEYERENEQYENGEYSAEDDDDEEA